MIVAPENLPGRITLYCGDCLDVLATLPENSIDACVCDPPYHLTSIVRRFAKANESDDTITSERTRNRVDGFARLVATGFMGKTWDGGDIAFRPDVWREVFRVLKPGGHLLSFGGTRTYHRMACAIEDAGFEIRDTIMWLYGSGFPKSHDVSKGIDRAAGAEREQVRELNPRNPKATGGGRDGMDGATRPWIEVAMERGYHEKDGPIPATAAAAAAAAWGGFGTALKPACEPIVLARKPLSESTIAANALKWGTGALNIDGCRVETAESWEGRDLPNAEDGVCWGGALNTSSSSHPRGRWPANVIHDGSEEVVGAFPESESARTIITSTPGSVFGNGAGLPSHTGEYGFNDSGSAARFFYAAKADADDRLGSKHPTVKPLDLMQYLVRLATPPNGLVLDPFGGTGTTGEAAFREGMSSILIEREAEYQDDIRRRARLASSGSEERKREALKAKMKGKPVDLGPLFSELNRVTT